MAFVLLPAERIATVYALSCAVANYLSRSLHTKKKVPTPLMLWALGMVLYLPLYLIQFAAFPLVVRLLGIMLSATYFMGAWLIGYQVARSFPVGRRIGFYHLATATLCAVALVPVTRLLLYIVFKPFGMIGADESFLDILRSDYTPYTVTYYITIVAAAHAIYYREVTARSMHNAAVLASELTRARARALESQLHPHFLFNALNSISAYVRDQPAKAILAAEQLKHLVTAVSDPRLPPLCTLLEEIDVVNAYLRLEQMRHGERLQTRFEIEPAALSARIPRFLLQPIVENAVRHGIAMSDERGCVVVRARTQADQLVVEIENDGPAIHFPITVGVGVSNTRRRLSRLYRGDAQFTLTTGSGGGCRAAFVLPRESLIA
jgi:two-component system LytT family sensor kinase